MKKYLSAVLLFIAAGCLFSCGGSDTAKYPVEKKYWTPEDYNTANDNIVAAKYNNRELPNLDNPKTADIFLKLVDTNNTSVVMNDDQLGITHRAKFGNDMFTEYKNLYENYSIIDRTDKYQYSAEFAEILKFGLHLQLYYISAGNEKIIKDADDPKAAEVIDLITSNQNVLIRNYDVYLDHINYEERFSDKALTVYLDGMKIYFPKLVNQFAPDGNFEPMLDKIAKMLKKTKNPMILAELENIKTLINSRVKKINGQ